MQSHNSATLAAYQARTQLYIDATPLGDENLRQWLDEVLGLTPKDGTIFEIGSGLGRDAEYIRSCGFSIVCSDAVSNFVEIVRGKGFTTHTLNILTDDIKGKYDLMLANAVLPHFTPEELGLVLDKVRDVLKSGGRFAFTLRKGSGSMWSIEKLGMPRYFQYWRPEDIKELVERHGFKWSSMSECHTKHNDLDWLLIVICKKQY